MAKTGTCFFDVKGVAHRNPEDATKADIAALLGKAGGGDSLAPGIATIIMEKRRDIERIFREHDDMTNTCLDAKPLLAAVAG